MIERKIINKLISVASLPAISALKSEHVLLCTLSSGTPFASGGHTSHLLHPVEYWLGTDGHIL